MGFVLYCLLLTAIEVILAGRGQIAGSGSDGRSGSGSRFVVDPIEKTLTPLAGSTNTNYLAPKKQRIRG